MNIQGINLQLHAPLPRPPKARGLVAGDAHRVRAPTQRLELERSGRKMAGREGNSACSAEAGAWSWGAGPRVCCVCV